MGDVESKENLPEEGERVGRREEGGGRRESGPPCGLQQTMRQPAQMPHANNALHIAVKLCESYVCVFFIVHFC